MGKLAAARSIFKINTNFSMEPPHIDRRRQELQVDDEEGLLQLQVCHEAAQAWAMPQHQQQQL